MGNSRIIHHSKRDFIISANSDDMIAGVVKPGWYFWNERRNRAVGPYDSRFEAELNLDEYEQLQNLGEQ